MYRQPQSAKRVAVFLSIAENRFDVVVHYVLCSDV